MNLLVPCAGRSSRFFTKLPKYLLSMPDGRLMFEVTTEPFLADANRVLFAVLKEHEDQFDVSSIIHEFIPEAEVLVLDEVTRGQAETVLLTLQHFEVSGPFLVKDSDSYFVPEGTYEPNRNYVSVCSARDVRNIKLYNKSFAVINEQGYVVGTVEKEITSEFFSCGGYFFADPMAFAEAFSVYVRSHVGEEFFLSQIIDLMIGSGEIFHPMRCKSYEDWGTHEDWVSYRKRVATYFFDMDGVIYENGSRFVEPLWGENKVFEKVREAINELYDDGNYIVLVTSRPQALRELTEMQLASDGLKYQQLMMGVHHGTRILVNDFCSTNPYPAAVAINTPRNSADFLDKLKI